MKPKLAGEFREIEFEELEGRVSRATGRTLRSICLEFDALPSLQDAVEEDLRSGEIEADDKSKWRVGTWSSIHRGDSDRKWYDVNLDETDDVTVDRIQFEDLDLVVSKYSHDDRGSDRPVVIRAIVEVDEEQTGRIRECREAGNYFDLTRSGIDIDPIRVRFGRPTWQWIADPDADPGAVTPAGSLSPIERAPEGELPKAAQAGAATRRFELVFVTEDGDSEKVRSPIDWQDVWIAKWSREHRAQMSALLSELVLAGALSDEAIARIEQAGDASDPLDLRRIPSDAQIWDD